ncbi:hypothetical protein GCM10022220_17070 [Actinocatenispora rupis]|uniref:UDP-N-acetylglucosamine:LPS N-acetylglucosamine transferase n=1 Tax=Actinocatenispora rupis TaxID=519421 RepID=A0A8J3NB33_9ACTN|nr:hypothetical protein Aru02nite_12440 [Actinocatenispora rupis]
MSKKCAFQPRAVRRRPASKGTTTRIEYLSRGHGHGHAATDVRVAAALRTLGAEVRLASYGSGLDHCTRRGVDCADLGIDDLHDQDPTAALRVLAYLRGRRGTDLVVAHEIFAAPSLCRALGLPCVLLTHWFFAEIGAPDRDALLATPDRLVLLDLAAAHDVPAALADRVEFTGPVAEPYPGDRPAARRQLGLDPAEYVVVVTTGAVTTHNRDRLGALPARVRAALPVRHARLLVLSGPTAVDDPAPYHRAADVVVANATFGALSELVAAGVPTVAVTGGPNPVDRLHAERFAALGLVTTVDADARTAALADAIRTARPGPAPVDWCTPAALARRLVAPPA